MSRTSSSPGSGRAWSTLVAQADPRLITGCVLSGLLSARFAHLTPTIGLVDRRTALDHYETLEALGFKAPDLQLGGTPLDRQVISDFRCAVRRTARRTYRGSPLMGLIAFLLRASRGVIVLSVLAGLTAGVAGVGADRADPARAGASRPAPDAMAMAWAFVGLCVVAAATRVAAQMAMVRLGQGAVAELGVHLVRRTLMLPLRTFEALDTSALLAALTEDIAILANALVGVPHLCINIPIVIACLAYTGWLSPTILACGVVFAALAIAAYVRLTAAGHAAASAAPATARTPSSATSAPRSAGSAS